MYPCDPETSGGDKKILDIPSRETTDVLAYGGTQRSQTNALKMFPFHYRGRGSGADISCLRSKKSRTTSDVPITFTDSVFATVRRAGTRSLSPIQGYICVRTNEGGKW